MNKHLSRGWLLAKRESQIPFLALLSYSCALHLRRIHELQPANVLAMCVFSVTAVCVHRRLPTAASPRRRVRVAGTHQDARASARFVVGGRGGQRSTHRSGIGDRPRRSPIDAHRRAPGRPGGAQQRTLRRPRFRPQEPHVVHRHRLGRFGHHRPGAGKRAAESEQVVADFQLGACTGARSAAGDFHRRIPARAGGPRVYWLRGSRLR